jgi:hypothetical protein
VTIVPIVTRIIWAIGSAIYLVDRLHRLGGAYNDFTREDVMVLLLIAGVGHLVWSGFKLTNADDNA